MATQERLDVFKKRHPKVRTGCMTCRQRHLKCDEGKPTCRRCQKDSKTCQGYQTIHTNCFEILSEAREKRSYHYFIEMVAPILPGHHDQKFWISTIRQVAYGDVAIQHAVVALGSIHEYRQQNPDNSCGELTSFAFEQYDKALRRLSKIRESSGINMTSIVCFVVFLTIELQLGRLDRAQSLLQTALNMLHHRECDGPMTLSEKSINEECISPMLTRFWLQAGLACTPRALIEPGSGFQFVDNHTNYSPGAPFETVNHARETLRSLLESIFSTIHFLASIKDTVRLELVIKKARVTLDRWKANFHLISTSKYPTETRAILLLQIQSQAAEMILRTVVSTRNLPAVEEFASQVDLCEKFLQLHLKDNMNAFFMDYAVIPALFFSAVHCPDGYISGRALLILRKVKLQEGFWKSQYVADVAEKLLLHRKRYHLANDPTQQLGSANENLSMIENVDPFEGCAWEFLCGQQLVINRTSTPGIDMMLQSIVLGPGS